MQGNLSLLVEWCECMSSKKTTAQEMQLCFQDDLITFLITDQSLEVLSKFFMPLFAFWVPNRF